MIEIEKKYFLEKQIFDNLQFALCMYLQDEYHEENILYNIAKPNVLRIRKIRGPQGFNTIVTYKGEATISEDGIKSRKEVEFSTSSAKKVTEFIEALNYRKTLIYEKKRTDYSWKGTTISLDELPFGYYMEIEGDPKLIKEIEHWLKDRIGIELDPVIYSYPDATQIYGKSIDGVIEARF